MRFMSMVKSAEPAAGPPPKALMEAIDQLVQEAAKAGCVMVACCQPRPACASDFQAAS